MKHISTIVNQEKQEDSDAASKRRTWAFVAGVMAMYYPDVRIEDLDGVKQTCILYHPAISGFSDNEYSWRMDMIRKVCECPNMPGLYGMYRNAQDALRAACGELCNLQHDYHIIVPKTYATGALEEIKRKELEHKPENDRYGKETIKSLKELF